MSEQKQCEKCGGEGVVPIPWVEYDPRRWAICQTCRGRGWVGGGERCEVEAAEREAGYDAEYEADRAADRYEAWLMEMAP